MVARGTGVIAPSEIRLFSNGSTELSAASITSLTLIVNAVETGSGNWGPNLPVYSNQLTQWKREAITSSETWHVIVSIKRHSLLRK